MSDPVAASVIVTIVDGGAALRACLTALRGQEGASSFEVIVPWDASVADIEDVRSDFPEVDFLALGGLSTERPPESHAGQHELFDRRRSAGLAAARGDLICILEDRGIPDPDWLTTLERLHATAPASTAAVGGGVECGVDRALNWAVYFCDFGRYQPPFEAGARDYVTDVNIAYRRDALEATRDLWIERYHETTVNWALTRDGKTLFLSPEPLIRQVRRDLHLGGLVRERLDWGRLFAYTRAREASALRRVAFVVLAPVLPVVLLVRHARLQFGKRRHFRRFLMVSPLVLVLLAAWSLGEFRGYLSGRP